MKMYGGDGVPASGAPAVNGTLQEESGGVYKVNKCYQEEEEISLMMIV